MRLKALLDSLPWEKVDPEHPMAVDLAMVSLIDYQEIIEDIDPGLTATKGWIEVFREIEVADAHSIVKLVGPVRIQINSKLKLGKVRIRCHHLKDNSVEWYVREIY
jgi:hypothetical protein